VKPVSELSRKELAGLVCETLTEAGIDVVLVGGSCVSIYTNEVFASLDLDFVALGRQCPCFEADFINSPL